MILTYNSNCFSNNTSPDSSMEMMVTIDSVGSNDANLSPFDLSKHNNNSASMMNNYHDFLPTTQQSLQYLNNSTTNVPNVSLTNVMNQSITTNQQQQTEHIHHLDNHHSQYHNYNQNNHHHYSNGHHQSSTINDEIASSSTPFNEMTDFQDVSIDVRA